MPALHEQVVPLINRPVLQAVQVLGNPVQFKHGTEQAKQAAAPA